MRYVQGAQNSVSSSVAPPQWKALYLNSFRGVECLDVFFVQLNGHMPKVPTDGMAPRMLFAQSVFIVPVHMDKARKHALIIDLSWLSFKRRSNCHQWSAVLLQLQVVVL